MFNAPTYEASQYPDGHAYSESSSTGRDEGGDKDADSDADKKASGKTYARSDSAGPTIFFIARSHGDAAEQRARNASENETSGPRSGRCTAMPHQVLGRLHHTVYDTRGAAYHRRTDARLFRICVFDGHWRGSRLDVKRPISLIAKTVNIIGPMMAAIARKT